MRSALALFVAVLVIKVVFVKSCIADEAVPETESFSARNNCGPLSLVMVGKMLGVERVAVSNIEELSHKDNLGTTMFGLRQAAEAIGLNAVGVRLTSGELSKLELPVIAFVDESHYFVIKHLHNELAEIIDPVGSSYMFYTLSIAELEARWSGYCLIVTRKDDLKSNLKLYLLIHPTLKLAIPMMSLIVLVGVFILGKYLIHQSASFIERIFTPCAFLLHLVSSPKRRSWNP